MGRINNKVLYCIVLCCSESLETPRLFRLFLAFTANNYFEMRLWKTNIIKKPRNLWTPPVPAWSVTRPYKTKERWTIAAFFVNVFLHPLRNPRHCKNKPFIGLQLVVMWFTPFSRQNEFSIFQFPIIHSVCPPNFA